MSGETGEERDERMRRDILAELNSRGHLDAISVDPSLIMAVLGGSSVVLREAIKQAGETKRERLRQDGETTRALLRGGSDDIGAVVDKGDDEREA
ncbi:hypothetical protein [Micromonospora sp. NPDC005299]|uniref:hypothetical protein n=1 Tax=Micromonospora sp. NPDC005299 TaxID=3364231 RepID=UPI0036C25E75